MANDSKYDFSYFEDDTPYVSHRDREHPSLDSDHKRTAPVRKAPSSHRDPHNNTRKTSRSQMKRMLIAAGAALIVLIIAVVILINAISGAVQSAALRVSDISDTALTLSWKPMNNVDGYSVYGKHDNEKDYTLLSTVSGSESQSVTVTQLEQAAQYHFYIVSVKGGKENRFGKAENITTLPSPPAFTLTSESEGAIHIEWMPNEKANGYILEYRKADAEYSADTRQSFDAGAASGDITGLEPAETYYVRMYSYTGEKDPVISPAADEQSVRVSRTEAQTASGAVFYDKFIDPDKPMVAFSFDDGPFDGVNSERILDTLEKYDVKATFFMVGCYVEDHPENLKRKVDLNMELGNHTWDHSKYGESITAEDISRCSDAIYEITGKRPTGFRPPGGAQGNAVLSEAKAENMPIYLWNVNSEDYASQNADAIYQMVMSTLADGNIIGMHDTYEATAEAVERMVPEILAQGYQIVSCHDLVVAKTGKEPQPGEIYYDFVERNYDE